MECHYLTAAISSSPASYIEDQISRPQPGDHISWPRFAQSLQQMLS